MSNRVIIAGAGGFGRGVYSWLASSPTYREKHAVGEVVFIDDGKPEVEPPAPVVSTVRGYTPRADEFVLCAVGVPAVRRTVIQMLSERGAMFQSFVDDRAVLGTNVQWGVGTIICPGVVISSDVALGDHVHINFNCSIGHDVQIGEYSTLSPACNLMGGVIVGSDVFFGGSVSVIPRTSVGAHSIVGAGSVVVRDVSPDVTTFGNPSRERLKETSAQGEGMGG